MNTFDSYFHRIRDYDEDLEKKEEECTVLVCRDAQHRDIRKETWPVSSGRWLRSKERLTQRGGSFIYGVSGSIQ